MKSAFKKLALQDGTVKQLDPEELSKNIVLHLLVAQQKKQPTKKSELVKSMNNQSKDFKQTISNAESELWDVFGMQLVGIKQVDGHVWSECPCPAASQFMIISKFATSVKDSSGSPRMMANVVKGSAIGLILNTLYILNREVKEEFIWNVLQNAELAKAVNDRQNNLHQFLKTELVDTMYATRSEVKTNDESSFQYTLGIRAHLECDKYAMLQHISRVLGKPITSFKKHYAELLSDKAYRSRIVETSEIEHGDQCGDEEKGQSQDEEMEDLQEDVVVETKDSQDSENDSQDSEDGSQDSENESQEDSENIRTVRRGRSTK